MQNQESKFKLLIKEAFSTLSLSYQELKDKYKDYPVCLMEYIEKGVHEPFIEILFDAESATLLLSFDKDKVCDCSFLFFDNLQDEELLIDYLVESADYSFRKSCWTIEGKCLKIKESRGETSFFCYRECNI